MYVNGVVWCGISDKVIDGWMIDVHKHLDERR